MMNAGTQFQSYKNYNAASFYKVYLLKLGVFAKEFNVMVLDK